MSIEKLSEHKSFDGKVGFYRHRSTANNCDMQFSVFVPAQATRGPVPVLTWLSGLTCTEETFMVKSGAQRVAAELGLMLVSPDTSPRGKNVPDDPEGAYDFGLGAGFYLNATEAPWNRHYHMYDYVTQELPGVLFANFPGDRSRQGLFGHSMGGHGALTVGLKNPERYKSISAFAPICSPINCPWGRKALGNYLGATDGKEQSWRRYDATELVRNLGEERPAHAILIDQGMSDQFLDEQLHPHLFEAACGERGVALQLDRHEGYDHGYYFIATFMEKHLHFHAAALGL
jgi:S-formylglutathione hydrolase